MRGELLEGKPHEQFLGEGLETDLWVPRQSFTRQEKDLQYIQQVVDAMEHILCGEDYEIPLPSAERIIAEVDSSVYKRYAGRYRFNNELAGQVIFADVVVEDDRLYMRLNNGMPLAMYPLNDTRFFFREDLAEVEFVGEENGRVQHLYFGSNDEMERGRS
ncbi:DUF3471 domain-containing protein [Paenibacillus sp. FSL M7-1046]|uniref:DUF3471 domain-containing protein n=1 Tax=Paenibacillus sp. FSL M7-1046 TaxID=2975315 RepID=UPI0030FC167A